MNISPDANVGGFGPQTDDDSLIRCDRCGVPCAHDDAEGLRAYHLTWCQHVCEKVAAYEDYENNDVCSGNCPACRRAYHGCDGIDDPCGREGCSECGVHMAQPGGNFRSFCLRSPPVTRFAWTWDCVTCAACLALQVTITPEYVTPSDTATPRDAYPTPGAHDARRSDSSMDTIDWNAKGEALARAHRAEGLPRTELLWVLVSRVRDGLETELATLSGPALDAAEQVAIKGYVNAFSGSQKPSSEGRP